MGAQIDYEIASSRLRDALAKARTGLRLPIKWVSFSRSVFEFEAKTWTPALATMLLAKSVDDMVDVLYLKVDTSDPSSYSARGLCHKVIVPCAVEEGFSIRNKGAEPLNNQPFFRYDRIDEIRKVRNERDLADFVEIAHEVNRLDANAALDALSAFLSVAIERHRDLKKSIVSASELQLDDIERALGDFLRPESKERPRRLQAFAAACLDLVFEDVKVRRLNDPSRDAPGDVQVVDGGGVAVAVEVRGKAVDQTALGVFARHCQEAQVAKAVMFVDAEGQGALDAISLMKSNRLSLVSLIVFSSWRRLLSDSILWTSVPAECIPGRIAERFLERLADIEIPEVNREEWVRAVASARS